MNSFAQQECGVSVSEVLKANIRKSTALEESFEGET
jgi:hypothetical protein